MPTVVRKKIKKKLVPARVEFKFPKYKKASEVLIAAKKVISRKNRWTYGHMAVKQVEVPLIRKGGSFSKSLEFRTCRESDKDAVAFCAFGSIVFVDGPAKKKALDFLREAAHRKLIDGGANDLIPPPDNGHIFEINDERGHKETLEMFSSAIELAQNAEK